MLHLRERVSARHTALYDFTTNPCWERMEAWCLFSNASRVAVCAVTEDGRHAAATVHDM